jgi:hypothetical protein
MEWVNGGSQGGGRTTMKSRPTVSGKRGRNLLAVLCAILISPGDALAAVVSMRPAIQQASSSQGAAPPIAPDQLDSLVAPIALYPDPLLAQTLAASTYPLEIMQLQQWLAKTSGLKDKALADAVAQQPWDASIQAMAALPEVVKRLADDIQWTTDLGNAFLAQQSGVMDAVQRMRQKAQGTGNLKSSGQQVVETRVVESKSVIVVEQANPQVVYVPSYNPMVVYGAPVYPYPPSYYPPPGAYAAGMAVSFGVGVAMGAAFGGGWGYGAGWGHNDVTINNNNNFNRNSNVNSNRSGSGGNNWQHRPEHRGGAPYRDRSTADRFGGTVRGDSLGNRQSSARQQVDRQGGNLPSNRAATGAAGAGSRSGGGGADRIGQRDLSRGGGGSQNAFGGSSQRDNGNQARASSNRGSSSTQSRGGGGSRSGGASRGGSRRGGGGRR